MDYIYFSVKKAKGKPLVILACSRGVVWLNRDKNSACADSQSIDLIERLTAFDNLTLP
ncbi:MAG: hypothetical protein KGQ89_02970 [Verrucomicrobia bacterium]|nr:hypothetical protein [Verrucomicrobiota bacterium]